MGKHTPVCWGAQSQRHCREARQEGGVAFFLGSETGILLRSILNRTNIYIHQLLIVNSYLLMICRYTSCPFVFSEYRGGGLGVLMHNVTKLFYQVKYEPDETCRIRKNQPDDSV